MSLKTKKLRKKTAVKALEKIRKMELYMQNQPSKKTSVIILAAGRGSRMNSNVFKALHKIAGESMLGHSIETAKSINPLEIIIVFNPEMRNLEKFFEPYHKNKIKFAYQNEQKGTAHAVLSALPHLSAESEQILILYADTPLLDELNLQDMLEELEFGADVVFMGFVADEPGEYGRFITDEDKLLEIVESKDATDEQLEIDLCNSGIVALSKNAWPFLQEIKTENQAKEAYLTDIVKIANMKNLLVTFAMGHEDEVMSVNDKFQLTIAESIMQERIKADLIENGAIIPNPELVTVSKGVVVEKDAIIHPNVVLGPGCEIKNGAEILPFSFLENCYIEPGAVIGPFARIRDRSVIGAYAEIGNFVEVKASLVGRNSKAKHLSYIGNTQIGEKSNIGAGVVTCNYNGFEKFKTEIGDGVFVGSNSSLIAPVTLGNGSMIAAGSVITENVPENDLAIARSRQSNLDKKAESFRMKYKSSH